jgi:hypothetical protein
MSPFGAHSLSLPQNSSKGILTAPEFTFFTLVDINGAVLAAGVEPARRPAADFKPTASACSAMPANQYFLYTFDATG